ncbi:hypothetical protein ACSYAD_09700 [Acaryochloris marina NIES-2412]|uniref:hypothetical protein n=1 Tax=Acaryochloris marina TaxID=155978 RepID=UPI00405818AB
MERNLLQISLNQFFGFSIYGIGVSVLGYRPFPNGLYRVTLWITIFFIPIFPLASRIVRPFKFEYKSANRALIGDSFGFNIIGQEPLHLANIIRTYILGWSLAFLALTPVVICVQYGQNYWPNGGSPEWFVFLTVASVIWPILILGILNHRKNQIHEGLVRKG